MPDRKYPAFFEACVVTHEQALSRIVKSGCTITSGFATSEPHTFYSTVWDHIVDRDLHDLQFRQGLFMAGHRLLVGDALTSPGWLAGVEKSFGRESAFGPMVHKANTATRKLQGLGRLLSHYDELLQRNITIRSGFLSAAINKVIPNSPLLRTLHPEYAGRNTSRMGITFAQSVHFPDAINGLTYDADDKPMTDSFVAVMTPPDENGDMSHGAGNGANGDMVDQVLRQCDVDLLLYVNPNYPFIRGHGDARNTVNIAAFEALARAGKLLVVHDDAPIPALPENTFADVSPGEALIADNVVNHMELNLRYTGGRAIQVGIGGTGVYVMKQLKTSGWSGRCYTEMLEPFTYDLFESGKLAGTHLVRKDGTREQLDGKLVCTFALAEKGTDFYGKLDKNPAVVMAPASRVVISQAFHYGLGVNSCLGIDFNGHVNSSSRDQNHYSGVGGGAMILRGLGCGGVAYLCLKSTHRAADGQLRSSIFPFLPEGTVVNYTGPDLMGGRESARIFLVTEHGIVQLNGKSQDLFIKAIISVADPRFRDQLAHRAWHEYRVKV